MAAISDRVLRKGHGVNLECPPWRRFDANAPTPTSAISLALACPSAQLSANALAFLWHSTASGGEARYSDVIDWEGALSRLAAKSLNGPEYDPGWRTMLDLLERVPIRELAKYAAQEQWVVSGGREVPEAHRVAYARLFLPPYRGGSLVLYRGCVVGKERHVSWTTSERIARSFAIGKLCTVDRHVVRTLAPVEAIICDTTTFMKKGGEDEIVVDPTLLGEIEVIRIVPLYAVPRPRKDKYVQSALRATFRRQKEKLRDRELRQLGVRL